MSSMIHPEWWAGYVADAQERVCAGWATFGEAVGFLVGDLLTSEEFLSFLRAETSARMAAGDVFDEAIYAVAEEAAASLQPGPLNLTVGRPRRPTGPMRAVPSHG